MVCRECRYFVGRNPGLCHRYPKHIARYQEDWCGEFTAKERKPRCTCGKEFENERALKVHVGKISKPLEHQIDKGE